VPKSLVAYRVELCAEALDRDLLPDPAAPGLATQIIEGIADRCNSWPDTLDESKPVDEWLRTLAHQSPASLPDSSDSPGDRWRPVYRRRMRWPTGIGPTRPVNPTKGMT
jgi:hypothetical protein